MRGRVGEALFNLSLLALGLSVITGAMQLGLGSLGRPGAGLFPLLAGIVITVPQLIVLFRFYAGRSEEGEPHPGAGSVRRLAVLLAIFGGWIALMPLLGYVVVTFLAVVAFAKALGLEGWTKPLALAAGASLGVYLLFDRVLFLDLPAGLLG